MFGLEFGNEQSCLVCLRDFFVVVDGSLLAAWVASLCDLFLLVVGIPVPFIFESCPCLSALRVYNSDAML